MVHGYVIKIGGNVAAYIGIVLDDVYVALFRSATYTSSTRTLPVCAATSPPILITRQCTIIDHINKG